MVTGNHSGPLFGAVFVVCYYKNMRVLDTDCINYKALRSMMSRGMHNGAYYYSREIVENIIPNVKTERPWDTLGMRGCGTYDNAIVFIHKNIDFSATYKWLKRYKNLLLVVSSWATYAAAQDAGYNVIFLPLSIDVEYVKRFKTGKTKRACYAGNKWRFKADDLSTLIPEGVDFPEEDLSREDLLKFIAPYKECYAIGRCALEAKVLGCKIKVCDSRYPDPKFWKVIDNKDAAKILQRELDKIDGVTR